MDSASSSPEVVPRPRPPPPLLKASPPTADITIDIERNILPTNSFNPTKGLAFTQTWGKREQDGNMDLGLQRAAAENDVDHFMDILGKISRERGLSQRVISYQVSPLGNTVLHIAAMYGKDRTVEHIGKQAAPWLLSSTNFKGDLPLHVSARAGHRSTLELLLKLLGSYLRSSEGSFYVTSSDDENTTQTVEPFMRMPNRDGNTCLHEALINGHFEMARDVLLNFTDPEVPYLPNGEGKSPLYLAIEGGHSLMDTEMDYASIKLRGKSPIVAAIEIQNIDILNAILNKKPEWIYLHDEEGWTPLHYAASIGYLEGVRNLLKNWAFLSIARDKHSFFPLHLASAEGHVDIIQELLEHCPDVSEMLNGKSQNILHIAAINGKLKVVNFILRAPELEKLINERDVEGNTALHLATSNWHPKIVSALTWDERVDLKLVNNRNRTTLDVAEHGIDGWPSLRQRLTWIALKAAGTRRGSRLVHPANKRTSLPQNDGLDNYKDRVNTLLLVATLVATVTFAAGFTVPGGIIDSGPEQGTATMVKRTWFQVFIFCNTIAMYGAITVAISLIWAQLGDSRLVLLALRFALPLLGVSLTAMSLAFLAAVSLVVRPLHWLATAFLCMGLILLLIFLTLYISISFPKSSRFLLVRYVSYFPFHLLASLDKSGSYIIEEQVEEPETEEEFSRSFNYSVHQCN